jgi:hypothetical protein
MAEIGLEQGLYRFLQEAEEFAAFGRTRPTAVHCLGDKQTLTALERRAGRNWSHLAKLGSPGPCGQNRWNSKREGVESVPLTVFSPAQGGRVLVSTKSRDCNP